LVFALMAACTPPVPAVPIAPARDAGPRMDVGPTRAWIVRMPSARSDHDASTADAEQFDPSSDASVVRLDASREIDAGRIPTCDGPTDVCICSDFIDGIPSCPPGMAGAKVIDPIRGIVHGCCPCTSSQCGIATCCGEPICAAHSTCPS
jgi:hypothetical protein